MSPAPRRRKSEPPNNEPVEPVQDSSEVTPASEATASNAPEPEVTSEDLEAVAPDGGGELDAEAVAAEAEAEPSAKPARRRAPARRRTLKAEPDAAEEPTAEEPTAEEPATEEPAAEEPAAEGPADKPAAKKPVADERPEKSARTVPAPRRRRPEREPDLAPPVVRAQAKYVRTSARKARLVCDHLRGKSVDDARAILAHTNRAVARDWSKLLESAVANAEQNHELVGEDLYVKVIHADEGPTIRRFRPRAMGRATKIRKRTSHLTIQLTPKD